MKTLLTAMTLAIGALVLTDAANASSVSEREYKRGYNDCLRGEYDQNQHGASYKRGCRAAEESGKTDPPPLKWSDLKYVSWHQGGSEHAKEEAHA